jgi:hypothetical protein
MAISIKMRAVGLVNYAQAGTKTAQRIKQVMRKVANAGRTAARRTIASSFISRSGGLKKQSGRMQTKVDVNTGRIAGRVTPLPNLLNIFERGATRRNPNRGIIRPRPVVGPAQLVMNQAGAKEIEQVLREVGK